MQMSFLARVLPLALLALAGCGTVAPSKSPMERGIESKHTLKLEPHRAAVCIARNIDEKRKALNAHIVPGREPVIAEVQVSAAKLIALAQLLVLDAGSTAVVWTTPELAQPRDELVDVMLKGC